MARFLEDGSELESIVKSDGLVIVDFFATWCGPCKMLMPVIDDFSKDMGEKVDVVKVDIDKFSDLAEKHNVLGVPSLFFFKDGQLQEISKGFKPKEKLAEIANQYL